MIKNNRNIKKKIRTKNRKKIKYISKIKRIGGAVPKISNKIMDNCGSGDIGCMSGSESKIPLEDIYHKPDRFGVTLDIPNETRLNDKFKLKCKGVKTLKQQEEISIDKDKFGYVLDGLDEHMLVGKQYVEECFDTEKNTGSSLPLGSTCFQDQQCDSQKCSNIKFFGLPGSCIINIPNKSVFSGDKCESDSQCKGNSTCDSGTCKNKPSSAPRIISNPSKKNSGVKGTVKKYVFKPKIKSSLKDNRDIPDTAIHCSEFNESDISKLINNDNYGSYGLKDKGGNDIECENSCKCNKIDKSAFCYKKKCMNIHKLCKNGYNQNGCVKNNYKRSGYKECCEWGQYCVNSDIEDINSGMCVYKDKVNGKVMNGNICLENSDCKSGLCDSNLEKCVANNYNNYCDLYTSCEDRGIYSGDGYLCTGHKCKLGDKVKKRSVKTLEKCFKNDNCVSNMCGLRHKTHIPVVNQSMSDKICVDSSRSKKNKSFNRLMDYIYKGNIINSKTIMNGINKLERDSKTSSIKYIICDSNYNDNSFVIFFDPVVSKFVLGKYIQYGSNQPPQQNSSDNLKSIIMYISIDTNIEDFKDFQKKVMVITDDSDSTPALIGLLNEEKIKRVNGNIYNEAIKISNLFLFDYICHMIFGEKRIITSWTKLLNFSGFYHFNNTYKNLELVNKDYTFDKKPVFKSYNNEDIQIISVPFTFNNNKIRPVIIDYTHFYWIIKKCVNYIKKTNYFNLTFNDYNKLKFIGSFIFNNKNKFVINNKNLRKTILNNYKKTFKLNQITNYSIFTNI